MWPGYRDGIYLGVIAGLYTTSILYISGLGIAVWGDDGVSG